jgi:DNA-binding CsgD family transcriptional regulator
LIGLGDWSTIVPVMITNKYETQIKVDINPSYEWSEKGRELGVSHRELEVLSLVVEGYKNKEIAQIVRIQHQSVKNHLQHLFSKLSVENSTQAYIIALNLNMIKMRVAIAGHEDVSTTEITGAQFVEHFRKLVSGEVKGFGGKDKRYLKVWLKEHGIEPYRWGDEK